jgi:hypothetical protein
MSSLNGAGNPEGEVQGDVAGASHVQEGSADTMASGESTAVDNSPRKEGVAGDTEKQEPNTNQAQDEATPAQEETAPTESTRKEDTDDAADATGEHAAAGAGPAPSEDGDGAEWEKVEKPSSPEKTPVAGQKSGVKSVAGGVRKVLKSGVFGGGWDSPLSSLSALKWSGCHKTTQLTLVPQLPRRSQPAPARPPPRQPRARPRKQA